MSPYAYRVLDLPAAPARWALEWSCAMAADVSAPGRWVLPAGPAQLHLVGLFRPPAGPTGVGPLVILPGWLVRRWVRIPIEVELSTWSGERSELALRSSCWPTQPRWYFPAAAGALRTLAAEITAWAWAAGRCVCPPDVPRARHDEESERGR